ncbi:Protein of unknown function (DUF3231) [Desulfosporosinus orientis DSM 765]|uniref:DUF3231 family protein n=1 Tax=Desulfosporosinus orientis (strain ATCC 19365 / DSM 765 / NCIMB 8382 / VKM B-1628 / Singapore I) TaxID=768706 RepID=G7WB90_DESOD|nr:DUF3231 family protein [Desulfosporosinus orientis]AET67871.1 Protein of unknown function (DUF3231) [Desulfosporosinus orientis DSM 765]
MSDLQQVNPNVSEQMPIGAIQHNLSNIKQTVAEISHLWSTYIAESMACAIQKHMVAHTTDPDFHQVMQAALDLSTKNIQLIKNLFNLIQHPIPDAFGEKDVNSNTPKLFDDKFVVRYTRLMTKFILQNHVLAFSECTRSDFRQLFYGFIDDSRDIIQKADDVLLAKGVFPASPNIVTPERVENIHDKNYYGSFLGSERPLNALEIANIFAVLDFKMAIRALMLGFAQVVKSDEIRKHLNKGLQIGDKQMKTLRSILENNGLPGPELVDYQVTDSKESPFSDRLILYHTTAVNSYIQTGYAIGLSRIMRKDIIAAYSKFMAEILAYSKDGADLLIEYGWLIKTPETADRHELTH